MPKILVIDDREDNLTSIKAIIKTYRPGYKTVTALSGEEGIKLAITEKPDTILLYINMAKMNGFEVCRQLKQDEELKHIPIIFLTAVKTSTQDRIKGLKLGGDAYLTEPIDSGELIAQLSVMLRIKEAEDKLRSEKTNLGELVEARMKDLSETNKKLQLEITERKQKELELLESKSKLLVAQRIAKMGFLSWNLKTNEIELSDEVVKLYGLDPETKRITPDFISNIVYFEDLEFVQNNLRMAVKGEKKYNIDHRVIRPNGEVIWVHAQAELICDDDGNAVSLIGTIIDITERKQAEERIARFSRIFEDSLNEIYLFESDTLKFTVVNRAAQQNLGYSIEELQNLTPIDIKPEFSTESFIKLVAPLRKGEKKKIVFRTVHKRKDQSLYDVEVHLQLMHLDQKPLFAAIILDITERKKAEKMLSSERDKFSYIFNSLPIGVTVLDSDNKYVFINSTSLKIDCYPNDTNLIGNNVRYNHPKNSLPVIDKLINDFKSGKITSHFREAKRGKRTVQISYHALYNHEGKYTGIIRLVSDITEKKKSELLLKESEKKYRELFEKSDDAILIIENNKFVDCNDSTVKMLRYKSKEELLNTHPSVLSPEFQSDGRQSFEKAEEMMRIAFQKGSHRFEWEHKKADGEVFPVEVLLTVVTFKEGKNTLHVVWRDITKRKKAEMELRESRQRLASHLDNTPLSAIFWDVDFKVTDWNKSAEKIFGYTKEEALGKHANELIVPKEIQDKVNDVFNHLLTQTGGERSTNENITKNGKRILCDWYNVAVTDLNGKITGVASLVDDITEKIKIRDELIEAKEKAEKSEKLKSEFLAQMSHEIRSPIHTILSFSQLLESELNDKIEGELRESFTAIKKAGQRVVRTIDLILDMSQIQTNSLETHFRNINLTEEILEPLYQEYYQAAKTKGLKLAFIKDTDDVNLEGDEYTLNQIVANLLNNAIKYTEKGEITLRVFRTEANLLAVEVADTGIGISEEYLPKIFDSFTQEEQGYSRHYDGNGLGLALVKKYCQINNADIFVESEKWKRSTFRVVF